MKFEDPNFSIGKKEQEYDAEFLTDTATVADAVLAYRGDFAIDNDGRDVGEALWTDPEEGKDFTLFRVSEDGDDKRTSYRLEFGPSQAEGQGTPKATGTYMFGLGEGSTLGRKGTGAFLDDEGKPNDDIDFHARRLKQYLSTGLPPQAPPEDVGTENPMISDWKHGSET